MDPGNGLTFRRIRILILDAINSFPRPCMPGGGAVPHVFGDYDGDGKTDAGVYRTTTSEWLIRCSTDGTMLRVVWGSAVLSDTPAPGDYDGDGKTDVAVYRTSTGQWFIRRSSDAGLTLVGWGSPFLNDTPIAGGDFDGDGKTDIPVYRQSTGVWFL